MQDSHISRVCKGGKGAQSVILCNEIENRLFLKHRIGKLIGSELYRLKDVSWTGSKSRSLRAYAHVWLDPDITDLMLGSLCSD